jgi:hypothetical protein
MSDIAASEAPRLGLRFLRRIATREAACAAARDARDVALKYAAEYKIPIAAALGDAYAELCDRCRQLITRSEVTERDLWLILTAAGQDGLDPYAPPSLIRRDASRIAMRPVTWLWPGRIALRKLTILSGEMGTGKSQLALAIAAAVTTGASWTCSDTNAPTGRVLLLSAEDDSDDTLVPRLVAAGADIERVRIIEGVHDTGRRRALDLSADLDRLEDEVIEMGDVRLMIIDPVTSYLGRTDHYRATEVRNVLEPLRMLASDYQLAVLALAHPPKSGGLAALHRILGSQAFGALARSVHVLTRDPDSDDEHRRLLLPAKANLASLGTGLALRLEQTIVTDGILASRVAWTGEEIARSADDVLRSLDGGGDDRAAREDAAELLRAELGDGERPVTELKEAARAAGISWGTVRRAQANLRIKPYQRERQWCWRLPVREPGEE